MSKLANYDPNIRWGVHTVKVTFQEWEYSGFVTFKIKGNPKGLNILNRDAEELLQRKLLDNNAELRRLDEDWFSMILTDEQDEELIVEEEIRYLNDYVVAVEIIDFVQEGENE